MSCACHLGAQPKSRMVLIPGLRKDASMTTCVDTAHLRVSYALNADDVSDVTTYVDWQCLEIGDSISKYYSKFLHTADSLFVIWRKEHPSSPNSPLWMGEGGKQPDWWSEYQFSEIFKAKGKMTVYVRMPMYLSRFDCWYSDSPPHPSWQLQQDTLTICGQLCQKATCTFRGRNFEAWFAPDIPISQGPWAFGGLPGLILKVQDTEQLYTFECCGIERGRFLIKKPDYSKYQKRDRKEVLKLQRKINENYFKTAGIMITKAVGIPYEAEPVDYEPLELE